MSVERRRWFERQLITAWRIVKSPRHPALAQCRAPRAPVCININKRRSRELQITHLPAGCRWRTHVDRTVRLATTRISPDSPTSATSQVYGGTLISVIRRSCLPVVDGTFGVEQTYGMSRRVTWAISPAAAQHLHGEEDMNRSAAYKTRNKIYALRKSCRAVKEHVS